MNTQMDLHIGTVAASTPEFPRKSEGDVIELNNGDLLLIYMEFGGGGDDFAHTRLAAQKSRDGGLTWGEHRVVTVTEPGDINVYSPNLIRAQDGGILLVFMRRHTKSPVFDNTFYVWKSTDEGESFEPQAKFVEKGDYSLCNAVLKRLSAGRLLLPTAVPVYREEGPPNAFAIAVLYSDDDGHTWQDSGHRLRLPMRGAMEPHVEETGDGRIVMVVRNQLGSLFMAESLDEGLTWSLPQSTGLSTPESCPELTKIPGTGDLLMIWNHTPYNPGFYSHYGPRNPLTSAISRDGGRTWGNLRNLETETHLAYSNPGCRFLSNGRALLNYWVAPYSEIGRMQPTIDLRAAVIEPAWFYEQPADGAQAGRG